MAASTTSNARPKHALILPNPLVGADARKMIDYYHSVADEPGDIFLASTPDTVTAETMDRYRELGVTWLG